MCSRKQAEENQVAWQAFKKGCLGKSYEVTEPWGRTGRKTRQMERVSNEDQNPTTQRRSEGWLVTPTTCLASLALR